MTGWLSKEEWVWTQGALPILCVDAIPIAYENSQLEIGLILRETPDQGPRWCFVGGRVRIDEFLSDALDREWRSAFGNRSPLTRVSSPYIVEYTRSYRPDGAYDLRKHAVSITYGVLAAETLIAQGPEALDFRWFHVNELNDQVMGFGQESVVAAFMRSSQFQQLFGH